MFSDSSLAPSHEPRATTLSGVPGSAEPLVLAELLAGKYLAAAPKTILHIAVNDRDMDTIAGALSFFAPDAEVLRLPAWDCLPYDRVSPKTALMAERMHTLSALSHRKRGGASRGEGIAGKSPHPLPEGEGTIILATANAAMQKLPPKHLMRQAGIRLAAGQTIRPDALAQALTMQGYRRTGKAMEPGEFALRGGIIDIVPPGMSEGIRLDLFGDEIESLKPFDPLTQLTLSALSSRERGGASRGEGISAKSPHPSPFPEGEGIILTPVSEVTLNAETIERFRERYRELFGAVSREDPLYEAVSQGNSYPGMEHWLPLFYERTDTLFDYVEDALITMDSDAEAALEERRETIRDYYEARTLALTERSKKNSFAAGAVYYPLPPERFFLMDDAWQAELARRDRAHFSPFISSPPKGEGIIVGYRPALRFAQGQAERTPFDQLKESLAAHPATVLACFSAGSQERLLTLLKERGFSPQRVAAWDEVKTPFPPLGDGWGGGQSKEPHPLTPSPQGRGNIYLAVLPLENGFSTPQALILSEQDVLGERIARAAKKKKKPEVFLAEASNLNAGELVVHKDHGIGRFEGLVTLSVSGAAHDCLKLVYEGDDKLFLPVENIEMITRFGEGEEGARLDKLGGASWQARKARLKERITLAAQELLKTAAQRQVKPGPVINTPAGAYGDFTARFPYAETEDQERSIAEVLEDLQRGRPMDRLVCGDVGFGKTEVALRAAFAAVSPLSHRERAGGEGAFDVLPSPGAARHPLPEGEGKYQVALIAPTTLLVRQHYRNFRERFAGFPVTIRQLSRMAPAKEQKDTREKLKSGEVDIVIGTHALLAKNIEFKNLGLLIVDEEQHFGVAQKEKLKQLKSDVHVLTLTATPIPRTLQMALTGVRDLSLITTPPVDRLAIRSFVMPFDPVVLREALLREQHRGGRSFIVTPRIKDIAEVKARIKEIAPEIKVAMAHGQMAAGQLDQIMNEFYDGKYDALLSTAIIESGLDIPTANTIIVHNAHMFGLSQLYQLRGRVGRAKLRAYAYFLLPPYRELTAGATKRLEAMQTLDTLGAGFTLASHDMDIRGFGNLVGEEQSGHIREVGIELYQQMLEEAVENLKRVASRKSLVTSTNTSDLRPETSDWSPQINLGISVLIPEEYVNDLGLRLGLYRRAAAIDSEAEIDSFAAELTDRFGPMPEETRHLIAVLGLKLLCKQAGIERIDVGPKGAVLSFRNNIFAKPEALLDYIARNARRLKARPDQKLVLAHEWKEGEDKLAVIKKLAGDIAALKD